MLSGWSNFAQAAESDSLPSIYALLIGLSTPSGLLVGFTSKSSRRKPQKNQDFP